MQKLPIVQHVDIKETFIANSLHTKKEWHPCIIFFSLK